MVRVAALCALLAMGSASAEADEEDLAAGRSYFLAGRALLQARQYSQALVQFDAGYHKVPKPLFLYNIAQVYKLLDWRLRAREYYRRYLAEAPRDGGPERAMAEKLLATLELQISQEGVGPAPTDDPLVARPVPERVVTKVVQVERAAAPAWYQSRAGWSLLVIGVLAAGGGLVVLGPVLSSANDDLRGAQTAAAWKDADRHALLVRDVGLAVTAAGGALALISVALFATHVRRESRVAFSVGAGGLTARW
jgi:hypothetical protein